MKRTVLLILLLSIVFCKGQNTVPSSCIAPDSIVKKYKYDAEKLAFRRVYKVNSTWKDSIQLDRSLVNSYLKALLAVYNATALPARDSAIKLYNCHAYNPNLKRMVFQADSNLQWMKNLRANVIPTGKSTVDSIMSKHYFQKQAYATFSNPYATAILRTDTSCNNLAIARTFSTVAGVVFADGDNLVGEGTEIVDSINVNYTWLVYSYGWVDCYIACYYRHYWGFKVYNDCSVEFTGSTGPPLNVGIRENSIEFSGVRVYPNPTAGKINLDLAGSSANLLIYNSLGSVVLSLELSQGGEIDISELPKGLYFLTFKNPFAQKSIKIVKE